MFMDEATKNKIIDVARTLENDKGRLKLFACIRKENEKKWDIIVSADWINYSSLKENIGDIFDAFKGRFNGEFALRFSGIYPLEITEDFVIRTTELFESNGDILELNEIKVGDVMVDKMLLVYSRSDMDSQKDNVE